jgi:hypothetical protein
MNDAAAITPLAETKDTVTLRRADYQALLEALEDASDVASLREAEAAVQRGESELLPIEMVERLLAGENPVRVWRTHRGMTAHALARIADLAPSYLSEIETKEARLLRCYGAPGSGTRCRHGGPHVRRSPGRGGGR